MPPDQLGRHFRHPQGRSAIPLNSRAYCDVSPEVAAYREAYSDGFVDSTTLRSEWP